MDGNEYEVLDVTADIGAFDPDNITVGQSTVEVDADDDYDIHGVSVVVWPDYQAIGSLNDQLQLQMRGENYAYMGSGSSRIDAIGDENKSSWQTREFFQSAWVFNFAGRENTSVSSALGWGGVDGMSDRTWFDIPVRWDDGQTLNVQHQYGGFSSMDPDAGDPDSFKMRQKMKFYVTHR
jgi:hypothetical protein